MSEQYAVRNIRLCTKDCLCLYVCPSGATDTENSIIDVAKCIGCGVCAASCPSGAISMVPVTLPPQQQHSEAVTAALRALVRSKSQQENLAGGLPGKLAAAIEKSNRIMAEDLIRESGYMLPQSGNAHDFLVGLLEKSPGEGFPKAAVEQLLVMLPSNETTEAIKETNEATEAIKETNEATEAIKEATEATDAIKEATQTEMPGGAAGEQWRCSVCGYLHTGSLPADFTCPRCKQPANVFIRVAAE